QAEDGIRDLHVTGVQTCALPIYGKENTILEICTQMGMSRTSLYRKIKALTGGNINDFVRKARLKKAVSLIKNEGYTISQASFEVGFKSPKYFRKIFKDTYGKLPSEIN